MSYAPRPILLIAMDSRVIISDEKLSSGQRTKLFMQVVGFAMQRHGRLTWEEAAADFRNDVVPVYKNESSEELGVSQASVAVT